MSALAQRRERWMPLVSLAGDVAGDRQDGPRARGVRADVRNPCSPPGAKAMWRDLVAVEVFELDGERWVRWEWTPEGWAVEGVPDPGYAEMLLLGDGPVIEVVP